MSQNKTVKISGKAEISSDGNAITIQASEGLVAVTATDCTGNVVYFWHPLSGWYVEIDLRNQPDAPQAMDE